MLIDALDQFLNECTNRRMFSYFESNNIKFNFSMNSSTNGSAGYSYTTQGISFMNSSSISYDALQEELFHGLQDNFYQGGLQAIIQNNNYGRSNIEFEAKLYADILKVIRGEGCCMTVQGNNSLDNEYYEWIFDFTNEGTSLPNSYSEIQDQYFNYLEAFKSSYPNYSFPTDPNRQPQALFSMIQTSNCN